MRGMNGDTFTGTTQSIWVCRKPTMDAAALLVVPEQNTFVASDSLGPLRFCDVRRHPGAAPPASIWVRAALQSMRFADLLR